MPELPKDFLFRKKVPCLKCGSLFMSWDRRYNRLCKRCKEVNELLLKTYTPEALGIESHSRERSYD